MNDVFQPVNDTARVNLRFLWDQQIVENVLDVRIVSVPLSQGEADAIHTNIALWIDASLQNQQSENVEFTGMDIVDLSADNAPRYSYAGTGTFGSSPGPDMPNETALCITKNTAQGGRSGRGRIFHIGLTQAMCAGNAILPANGTAILNSWTTLATTLQGIGNPLVVVSRVHAGVPRPVGLSFPVLSLQLKDRTLDSQRRRKPGNGR